MWYFWRWKSRRCFNFEHTCSTRGNQMKNISVQNSNFKKIISFQGLRHRPHKLKLHCSMPNEAGARSEIILIGNFSAIWYERKMSFYVADWWSLKEEKYVSMRHSDSCAELRLFETWKTFVKYKILLKNSDKDCRRWSEILGLVQIEWWWNEMKNDNNTCSGVYFKEN